MGKQQNKITLMRLYFSDATDNRAVGSKYCLVESLINGEGWLNYSVCYMKNKGRVELFSEMNKRGVPNILGT